MRSEKIQVDRGVQLDQMRLRGEHVDVHFVVEGKRHPAHRFIVGLYSPVLKMLTAGSNPHNKLGDASYHGSEGPVFVDCGRDEIELKGLTSEAFEPVLSYLYTGTLILTEENVFVIIETCQFLQIEDKLLKAKFGKYLSTLIDGVSNCDVTMLLKVWCLAEQFVWPNLIESVLKVIDLKLELFLSEDMFMYLGFEEIRSILSRPTLCVRSEKLVFDSLLRWAEDKVSVDDPQSQDLALRLFQLLSLDHLKKCFVIDSLVSIGLDKSLVKIRRPDKRSCQDCTYITLHSRSENEIRGIEEFVQVRKSELNFFHLNLNNETAVCLLPVTSHLLSPVTPSWNYVSHLTNSKTYYQHYGPHEGLRGSVFVTTDTELILMGCQKNSAFSSIDGLSNTIKIFDYTTQSWMRTNSIMPKRLSDFGLVCIGNFIYLLGGLTDRSSPTKDSVSSQRHGSKALIISTDVYRIKASSLREGLKCPKPVSWTRLSEMPTEKKNFTATHVDTSKIFVVGKDFCDVYDIDSDAWTSVPVPFSCSADNMVGVKPGTTTEATKPVTASLGTNIYVFGPRPHEGGVNAAWVLDTRSLTWTRLIPSLEIRYDPKGAFSHNGLIYLIGWQAATDNFVHSFDPIAKRWGLVLKNVTGDLTQNGIIMRKAFLMSWS